MTPEMIAELREAGEVLAYVILGVVVLLAGLKTWRTHMVARSNKGGDPEI